MKKVLIVEDDRWMAENHHRILESAGFDCFRVHDAERALETIDEFQPDVIVLDFLLPQATAMQLLHELQSYDDTHVVPVVLCTSVAEAAGYRTELQKYGVRIVLDKATMTPKQLTVAVTDVL